MAALGDAVESILIAAVTRHPPSGRGRDAASEIRSLAEGCADAAVGVILHRQPGLGELRRIVSALRVSDDYERIAGLADEIVSRLRRNRGLGDLPSLRAAYEALAALTLDQFRMVRSAERNDDLELCETVWRRDRLVDAAYARTVDEAVHLLSLTPQTTYAVVEALCCAKNLQRISDHAKSVADMFVYSAAGRRLSRDRDEASMSRRTRAA
ncbi:hypothetical protein IHQ68_11640 [Chelatococcus sambhunathii]|uniref:PhoU domain-containing protein n=1 Tax=Chelatococcus sambhunathii TaxID=363953 RepID=A0ABU1DGL7_9HYPH|nr:PhoU domain-containing protein [Chelatococcus sambhunathii]MDR4307271.1 hypothetical protein [Chelatococcus sambhunathii]